MTITDTEALTRFARGEWQARRAEGDLRESWPLAQLLMPAEYLAGRIDEARTTVQALRELEPSLTAGGFRSRYPGRDSAHAARFADALLAAGLPA